MTDDLDDRIEQGDDLECRLTRDRDMLEDRIKIAREIVRVLELKVAERRQALTAALTRLFEAEERRDRYVNDEIS